MSLKLTKRKGSPYYYLRGTVAGQHVLESTGTRDRGQAEAFRIKRERETWEYRKLGKREPATFAEAAVAYMQYGGERRFLGKLIEYFRETPIGEIRQTHVDQAALALHPGCKPSTLIRHVYGPMIAILTHAAKSGLEGARFRQITFPKVKRGPARWASDEEIAAILAKANEQLRALVLLMTYTGLRIGECLRIKPRDLQVRPGWVSVGHTKNSTPAMVPLVTAAQEALQAIVTADRVFGYRTSQGVNKALRTACRAAGMPEYSTHEIGRHAFAARLLNAGYDIKTVKEAGRWKKLAIVDESYGHLEMGRVHDAMLAVATGVIPRTETDASLKPKETTH